MLCQTTGNRIVRPTVFVLGAGASVPYYFPADLNAYIRNEIQPENSSPTAFRTDLVNCGVAEVHVRDFGTRLRDSGLSVDDFIVRHPDYREVGKLAIARAVAPWEDAQVLKPGYKKDEARDGQRWYHYLFKTMLSSTASGPCSISDNQLRIVTFNFDRSFEQALYDFALANCVRDFDPARAAEIAKSIPVYHVHGQLGFPSWLQGPSAGDDDAAQWVREYGSTDSTDFSPSALRKCAEEIRIIDDEVEHDPVVHHARKAIADADRVCFLGFSYNPLNLRKLRPGETLRGAVWGTAYGLSTGEAQGVKDTFKSLADKKIHLSQDDVLTFLRQTSIIHN